MTTNDYQAAVAAYADELRSLFAPEPASSRSAEPQAASIDTLAERADRLAERSTELLDQTVLLLSDDAPECAPGRRAEPAGPGRRLAARGRWADGRRRRRATLPTAARPGRSQNRPASMTCWRSSRRRWAPWAATWRPSRP